MTISEGSTKNSVRMRFRQLSGNSQVPDTQLSGPGLTIWAEAPAVTHRETGNDNEASPSAARVLVVGDEESLAAVVAKRSAVWWL